ncbi:DUF1127 domain-containing protein [Algirhabdus cladophorae]|uniref:DUF1127 domain-containing protein n=1 Tax=Algirhabdus cladophorae TaxID=3377108 RepID=UPI003B845BC0
MAAFDTSRPMTNAAGVGSFSKFIASTVGAVAAWNDRRVTRNALDKLSDRELEDIGLCRGDLENV